nr:hypothetical protein [Bacilli bacterium]
MKKVFSALLLLFSGVMLIGCNKVTLAPATTKRHAPITESTTKSTKPTQAISTVAQYDVEFCDADGSRLDNKKWDKNSTPSYTYEKAADTLYVYNFKGWSLTQCGEVLSELPKVEANAKYYAVVEKQLKTVQMVIADTITTVDELKDYTVEQVTTLFNSVKTDLSNDAKELLQSAYDAISYQIATVEGTFEELKAEYSSIYSELVNTINSLYKFAQSAIELKDQAKEQLTAIFNAAKDMIPEAAKTEFEAALQTAKNAIDAIKDDSQNLKAELAQAVKEYSNVVAQKVQAIIVEKFAEYKEKVLGELDAYVTTLSSKIPFDAVKTAVQSLYTELKTELNSKTSFEELNATISSLKERLVSKSLSDSKQSAIQTLNGYKEQLLAKLEDQELISQANQFFQTIVNTINEIVSVDNLESVFNEVQNQVQLHVKDQLQHFEVSLIEV